MLCMWWKTRSVQKIGHTFKSVKHISESPKIDTRWRFNVSLLENPTFGEQFETELNEFIMINKK